MYRWFWRVYKAKATDGSLLDVTEVHMRAGSFDEALQLVEQLVPRKYKADREETVESTGYYLVGVWDEEVIQSDIQLQAVRV